ncbi:MAG: glycosyltransferase [Nitrospinae bacterium]|nr:glycosyltransferase [Nitrospinota bacterium]
MKTQNSKLITHNSFDIVCSANLYWDKTRWQRPNHIMSQLSKYCRILYVRPLDIRFYIRDRKKWRMENRYFKANQNLTIFFPIVFPFAERLKIISFINKILMIARIRIKIWSLGFKNYILWFYTPKSAYLMGKLNEKFIIYDIMDEHSKFKGAHEGMDGVERRLIERSSVVFTGTKRLWEGKRVFNSNSFFSPCGVDYQHFAKAQNGNLSYPPLRPLLPLLQKEGGAPIRWMGHSGWVGRYEMTDIPSPIVGYVGAVDDRLDYDLIRRMAELHPEWSIVFIGPFIGLKMEDMPEMKNIFYLGGKKYEELPEYIKYFNVCIMPFVKNPLTDKINPTKALEYMAAGKPIVSTHIPDITEFYSHIVKIGYDVDSFIRHVEREINTPDLKGIAEGIRLSKERTWEKVAESMYYRIENCKN